MGKRPLNDASLGTCQPGLHDSNAHPTPTFLLEPESGRDDVLAAVTSFFFLVYWSSHTMSQDKSPKTTPGSLSSWP